MTVAIAALCGFPNEQIVIAAADHMITAGDIEFEQPQPKIWQLAEHAVAMMFGLSAAQGQIGLRTQYRIHERGITDIGEMAETYAWFTRDYVRREAEADVLAPLQLSTADLTAQPLAISPALARHLTKQMQTYYRGSGLSDDLGGAIILGTDDTGGHICKIEDGHVEYMDSIGFVAAGGGRWHAESQFMFARYTREWSFPDAMSLVYAAKKRAEVAPGVGSETDIVVVTTRPKNVIHANTQSEFVAGLQGIYQTYRTQQDEALARQHAEVKTFIDGLLTRAASPDTSADSTPPALPPSDPLAPQGSRRGPKRRPASPE